MPVIIKRPLARSDLAEIWDYIADDNERRADAFVDLIDRKFQELARHPNMGLSREELGEGTQFPGWPVCHLLPSHTGRRRNYPRPARLKRPERHFQSQ
jgi:plasmid stabilization system protein ParE